MFFTIPSGEFNHFNKDICFDDFLDETIPDRSLLYQVVWGEARGEGVIGITGVVDVIRNRIESDKFPNTLDSVLIQKHQFYVNTSLEPTIEFKALVDSIYSQPIVTPYLYFVNFKWAKKASWMYLKERCWVKINNHHFSK